MLDDLFETKMIGRVLNSIYTETYTSEVLDVVSRYMSVDVIKPLKDELEIFKPVEDEFGDSYNTLLKPKKLHIYMFFPCFLRLCILIIDTIKTIKYLMF